MTQKYEPVEWTDETPTQPGTLINKARLDQMQSAHHFADGFEEVDAVPTEDPGTDYHKVVYCTADSTFYRWDGTQWTADIDDDTKRLLEEHEADHANPHAVTKAQVGLGNVDNTSDANKPVSTATQAAIGLVQDYLDAHEANHSNPHQVTKAQVGLGNADNTADLDKPISTATAAALATKANDSAVVHRTGDETISGNKTFMADTNNNFLLEGETALGAELKIGSAATGSDPLGQIQFVKLPTLATVAIIESDADGLLTLSGSTAVTIRDQRAYAAANTSDVATIATLDAYTPMVRTVNNQTINGTKTFLVAAVNNQKWRVQNNNEGISTVPAAQVQTQPLDVADANGAQIYFDQMLTNTDGSRAWRQNLYGTGGHRTILHMQVNADGTSYLTAPARTYNTANEADVVTIGTLKASTDVVHTSGPETIAGTKTFTDDPMIYKATPVLALKETIDVYNTAPSSNRYYGIGMYDKNGTNTGAMGMGHRTNGGKVLYLNTRGENGSIKEFDIIALQDGTAYMTGPSRAYDPANTTDVATIGTLDGYTPMVRTTGNQTINGDKVFSGAIAGAVMGKTVRYYNTSGQKWFELARLPWGNTNRYVLNVNGGVNGGDSLCYGKLMVLGTASNFGTNWIIRKNRAQNGYLADASRVAIVPNGTHGTGYLSLYMKMGNYWGIDVTLEEAKVQGAGISPNQILFRSEFTAVDLDDISTLSPEYPTDMAY